MPERALGNAKEVPGNGEWLGTFGVGLAGRLAGQGDGAEDAGPAAQTGRDDEGVDGFQDLGCLDLVVEQRLDFGPDQGEEVGLLHDAAAENEPLGREDADEVDGGQGQVMGL